MNKPLQEGPKQSKGLKGKSFHLLLTVAALIFSLSASSQTRVELIRNDTYYNYKAGAFRQHLYIPLDTFSTVDSGDVAYKNGRFYLKLSTKWVDWGLNKLNDSTYTFGKDTFTIVGGTGGGAAPGGTDFSLQYKVPGGTFGGTNKVVINPSSGRIASDSLFSKLWRGDSIKLARQFFTYLPTGLGVRGDSFTFGSYATPRTDSGFAYLFANYMGLPIDQQALSGTGCFYNIKNFHATVGLSNDKFQIINVGYNDLRATGTNVKTYAKNVNAYKAAFLNHFASVYVDAGGTGVTRYGTWTTGVNATNHAGKSANAAYTSTLNDSIVYSFTGTSVGVGMMGSDGIVSNYASFDAYIDGVLHATYNANNQTDGAVVFANPNHTDSVFCYPVLIHGLSNGSHKLKLVNKSNTGQRMFADYFTTLAPASTKPPLGVFHLIAIQSYYIASNSKVDSMVATLPAGYPFAVFKINNYFVEATDMDIDGVHPNNLGHLHYFYEMRDQFDPILANLPDGVLTWDQWLYATSNGISKQVPYAEDVHLKSNDNILFAGKITIPSSKAYGLYQGSILLTNYDAVLQNFRLAGGGNPTLTGGGNYLAMEGAGLNLTSANNNIAIGPSACLNCTTGSNISIGSFTNAYTTTGLNIAIGSGANQFGAGTGNTAVGLSALNGNVSYPFNSSTAFGYAAGQGNRADNNTFFGAGSGFGQNISGGKNFLAGYNAGMPDPTVSNFMNVNNAIWGRNTSGQGSTAAGLIGIVNNNPLVTLDIGGTDAVRINGGTTAQRPTGAAGYLRWNTDSTAFEYYDGSAWKAMASRDWVRANAGGSPSPTLGITYAEGAVSSPGDSVSIDLQNIRVSVAYKDGTDLRGHLRTITGTQSIDASAFLMSATSVTNAAFNGYTLGTSPDEWATTIKGSTIDKVLFTLSSAGYTWEITCTAFSSGARVKLWAKLIDQP
ncbi:hypothetical protein [Paraflavitalea sp. CAU 1676]|uniref:hypothetical protein n=1 Tax=Paraflavitalea sp. CAU 1676 TaxID=3032598 RepID=UPI0023DC81BB|nr:hypothetical protein [Paraflavitalea sp. CAU 1676]MDF2189278.1 hypothetical protein [Paraflavitalea sp. CAU 1676]